MEGMKLLQVQIKPILKSEHVLSENELCHLVDPDVVSVLIDDTIEDSKSINFFIPMTLIKNYRN